MHTCMLGHQRSGTVPRYRWLIIGECCLFAHFTIMIMLAPFISPRLTTHHRCERFLIPQAFFHLPDTLEYGIHLNLLGTKPTSVLVTSLLSCTRNKPSLTNTSKSGSQAPIFVDYCILLFRSCRLIAKNSIRKPLVSHSFHPFSPPSTI